MALDNTTCNTIHNVSQTREAETTHSDSAEAAKAYAFLRERFLHFLSSLPGESNCTIHMYEDTKVTAQIKAVDSNFQNIIVENLKTPLPDPVPKAILRTSDIIAIIQHLND